MCPISDGQAVDAANSNPAWLDAQTDDSALGKIGFANTDVVSGSWIENIQRYTNNVADTIGLDTSGNFTAEADATGKDYGAPADTINDGDSHKLALTKLAEKFDPSTGHTHDGTSGEGPQIEAADLASVPFRGYFNQGLDLIGVTGGSTDVTTEMTGKTPSAGPTSEGVVVTAPYNKTILRDINGEGIEDGSGNVVYGRITESSGTWTLTYYSAPAAVETPYSFGVATDIIWYYQELYNPMVNPPVYSEIAIVPSDNPTQDVIDATTTQKGKVQLSAVAPAAISATGAAGTGNATVANANHTHEGVHSTGIYGNVQLYLGDVKLKAGNNITLNDDIVNNAIEIESSNSGVGYQEVPTGTVNGSNTTFGPLTYVPTNEDSVLVFVNSLAIDKAEWSIVGNSIVFSVAPIVGSLIYVFYLTDGTVSPPPVISGAWKTEYRTLTGGEITAAQLTLAQTPSTPTEILVDVLGGGIAWYTDDFVVSGNILDWSGLGLDGLVSAGDKLRIGYVY